MAEQINATDRRISTHRFVFNTGIGRGGGGGGCLPKALSSFFNFDLEIVSCFADNNH